MTIQDHYLNYIKTGDETLFIKLRSYFKGVLVSKYKLFDNDDIIADTIIILLNVMDTYDSSRALFITWATSILINKALQINKQLLKKGIKETEYYNTIGEYEIENKLEVDIPKLLVKIDSMLKKQEDKNIFNLYIRGYTYDNIALELDIPLSQVKNRLFKIRIPLRKMKEYQEYKRYKYS
jgi:RNA polymerase sigma factor (sigma-70 family)